MRQLFLAGWFLLAGCQGVVGPLQRRCLDQPPDNPCLTIEEQLKLRRDRVALPENSPTVGPRTYAEERAR